MVVPLVRDKEVIGVFELLADRANAFEERDVTALERLAEMVQTGLEHADAAKRAQQEIAAKSEQATAEQTQQEQSEAAPARAEIEVAKDISTEAAAQDSAVPEKTAEPETNRAEPVRPPELDKIGKCGACGFPVSEGRTLCLDCEVARLSGESPAPLASNQAPAFLAKFENRKEKGWLGSHIYTIGTVLIVVLTVVLLVLRLR
jgi:hypothetical protein